MIREIGNFDLERLGAAIKPERDFNFNYLGMQTLYDRYFIKNIESRIELPQAFFMREAMGLAINEIDPEKWSIKFYDSLSSFDFMSSTPTLFNSDFATATIILLFNNSTRRFRWNF